MSFKYILRSAQVQLQVMFSQEPTEQTNMSSDVICVPVKANRCIPSGRHFSILFLANEWPCMSHQ